VLIDYHPMGLEWIQNDEKAFVAGWKWVWSSVACLPNFNDDLRGRVFVDIMNEVRVHPQIWLHDHQIGQPKSMLCSGHFSVCAPVV